MLILTKNAEIVPPLYLKGKQTLEKSQTSKKTL